MEWRWDGGLQRWMDGLKRWINSMRTDKKVSHNVGQRTSALCCHGNPLMARSFSIMDAFHRFNGVCDGDMFFLCIQFSKLFLVILSFVIILKVIASCFGYFSIILVNLSTWLCRGIKTVPQRSTVANARHTFKCFASYRSLL